MIKLAVITGLLSTGVEVADLRVLPWPVGRHVLKTQGFDAGVHVGTSPSDPEAVQIRFYEPPGIQLTAALQKEIEKNFTRQELRRVAYNEVGAISYPTRVRESYAQDLVGTLDVEAVRRRGYRIVVDYGYSAASFVLPLVLGPLAVEAVSAHGFSTDGAPSTSHAESIDQARRLLGAMGADLAVAFDATAERLHLIDERGREIPVEQGLLLMISLLARSGRSGRVAVPVTTTSAVNEIVDGSRLEIVRTRASLAELTRVAAGDGVVFAGALSGGYVFPDFLPAYDGVASLAKLLELLAPLDQPLSALVDELPQPALVHTELHCPWALKGLVMRMLTERLKDRETDLLDGIKVFDERGWAQVLPDPDEPLVHVYAEGGTPDVSADLLTELRERVEEIVQGRPSLHEHHRASSRG